MTDIGPHLERLGLEQYLDAFLEQGFDSWETVLDIKETDFETLNVKLGHRRKLQRAIADYRGISSERPLESPAQETPAEVGRAPEAQHYSSTGRESGAAPAPETKRKYRRHPKTDENAPEKPPSAYVLFSNKVREEVKGDNLTFTAIARLVGDRWQKLEPEKKEPFESHAAALKESYTTRLAEYKKTENYQNYLQYLAEFKAKHGQQAENKRPKLDAHSSGSFSAASTGEVTEIVSLTPGHNRGGSMGSMSIASQSGTFPSPAGLSSGPNLPMHTVSYATTRSMAGSTRGGSPQSHQYLVSERRLLGPMSSQSSVSEDSSANRSEQPDPLSRAATLSLSTPPIGTPPSTSTTSLPPRREQSTGPEGYAWSQRYQTSGHYLPAIAPSVASPSGSGLPLSSPQQSSDYSRSIHHAAGLVAGPQLPPFPFAPQRTLPPLRAPPIPGGPMSPSTFQNRSGGSQPSPAGSMENTQLSHGQERLSLGRSESDAGEPSADSTGQGTPEALSSSFRRRRPQG